METIFYQVVNRHLAVPTRNQLNNSDKYFLFGYPKSTLLFLALIVCYSCTNQENNGFEQQQDTDQVKKTAHYLGTPQVLTDNSKSLLTRASYSKPVWSPDGEKLLFTKANNVGLYLVDFEEPEVIRTINELPGVGRKANWAGDSKRIYFVSEDPGSKALLPTVQSVNIDDNNVTDHPSYLYPKELNSSKSLDKEAYFVFTNPETLQIEAAVDTEQGESWVVTSGPNPYYYPILSPDRTKVIVHQAAFMYVYASDGTGMIDSLGVGQATSWSPDSEQILYFIDEGDGHQITKSEIFICHADGSDKKKLTNTEDIVEMWASWSPKGDKIAYSDDKSGSIMIAEIKE